MPMTLFVFESVKVLGIFTWSRKSHFDLGHKCLGSLKTECRYRVIFNNEYIFLYALIQIEQIFMVCVDFPSFVIMFRWHLHVLCRLFKYNAQGFAYIISDNREIEMDGTFSFVCTSYLWKSYNLPSFSLWESEGSSSRWLVE